MKLMIACSMLLLTKITAAPPANSIENIRNIISEEFYKESMVTYKSKHDIVSIVIPMNSINIENNKPSRPDEDVIFFFVEADMDADGKRTYHGLFVFKDGKATKLLDNGRGAAASTDHSKKAFFAANDGIYEYKSDTNEAVKYGSITDNIIDIATTTTGDDIYILTENHELYKVTDEGNTKVKVDEVVNAQEIVLDYSNNIYFYDQDKKPYVLSTTGLKNVKDLPPNPNKVNLVRPLFILKEYFPGVPFIADNAVYMIYANGSSVLTDYEFTPKAKPTALAMEFSIIQYYAYNKKIYEYNIVPLIFKGLVKAIQNFLDKIFVQS